MCIRDRASGANAGYCARRPVFPSPAGRFPPPRLGKIVVSVTEDVYKRQVTTIGFSLLSTGISSFASSSVYPTGAWQNLLVAVITLAACLIYNSLAKGFWKQLYVLFGLIVGYICLLYTSRCV